MRKVIFYISLVCIIASCKKKDNIITDPPTEINFSIQQVNTDNDYTSEVEQFSFKQKLERWSLDSFEEISFLTSMITYTIELKNGATIDFSFEFIKRKGVSKEELILEEPDGTGLSGKKWDFTDIENKINNFYKSADFNIIIGWNEDFQEQNLSIKKLEKAIVNSEEKVYIEIDFSGKVCGVFDPNCESQIFEIANGNLKGIID